MEIIKCFIFVGVLVRVWFGFRIANVLRACILVAVHVVYAKDRKALERFFCHDKKFWNTCIKVYMQSGSVSVAKPQWFAGASAEPVGSLPY